MPRRALWVSVVAGAALSLAGAARIAGMRVIIGSREGAWFYRYLNRFDGRFVELLVIASVLAAAAVWSTWPKMRGLAREDPAPAKLAEWSLVGGWCLGAVVLQALVRSLTPYSLGAQFASDTSNSFYSVAISFDTNAILGDFDRLRTAWPLHAQSNLPGKALLVRLLTNISLRPDVLAWLVVILSNLGGALVYVFVRDLFKDRFMAAIAVLLYLFIPARLYFFPLLNTVTPVLVFLCGCLLLRWLDGGRIAYAVGLGIAVYGLAIFEPTALIAGILFAALIVRAVLSGQIAMTTVVRQVGAGVAAFAAVYVAMRALFGFDLVQALRVISADATQFNVLARRPYEIWVRQNIYDFLFGVGLCQVVLFFVALADAAALGRRTRTSTSLLLLSSASLAMLAIADLLGINRGEVIRLWIFLACFWQIPSAYVCRRLDSAAAFTVVLLATLLQSALGTLMIGFVEP